MDEEHDNLFVTLDEAFDNCNVNHLSAFVSNLQKVLNISDMTLRLCQVEPGSLKLIFQLPCFVQQAIFPLSSDQKVGLSDLGVVQLSCGEYTFSNIIKVSQNSWLLCIVYNIVSLCLARKWSILFPMEL